MKSILPTICLAFSWMIISCTSSDKEPVFHPSHVESRKNNPFSDAVEAGGFLFLTGQLGLHHETGELAAGGIRSETEQAIKNIEAVLKHHGSSLDNVVKCTVILSNIDDFKAFNEIYVKYFPNKPARTTYAAAGLARNAAIEIDVIATK